MNLTIPFTKDVIFKTKIAEICSISLEHDVSINEGELLGDFIISGEYKSLDVNVDTAPFTHVVPFSITLDDNIDLSTLNYEITDFSYDAINDDTLRVNITMHVDAKKNEVLISDIFEKPEEEVSLEDSLNRADENEEEVRDLEVNLKEEETINNLEQINIIKGANLEDDFITYHVHLVSENETIDQVCLKYKISKEDLLDLNEVEEIAAGDKLIIPDIDDGK